MNEAAVIGSSGHPCAGECNSFRVSPNGEVALELEIESARQRLCAVQSREEKLAAWREMCRLMDQRTPHRVRFMERMRGLA
jgi:hypothetical protein